MKDGKTLKSQQVAIGTASRDELISESILGDKEFSEELERYWQELKNKTARKGSDGKVQYWDFIGGRHL